MLLENGTHPLCIGQGPAMPSGPGGCHSGSTGCGRVVIMLSSSCFPSHPSLAGVNSFMVYMAYKDLYQVSNTEVITHHCVVWGLWMAFLWLPVTLALCT